MRQDPDVEQYDEAHDQPIPTAVCRIDHSAIAGVLGFDHVADRPRLIPAVDQHVVAFDPTVQRPEVSVPTTPGSTTAFPALGHEHPGRPFTMMRRVGRSNIQQPERESDDREQPEHTWSLKPT